jgi:hypothetical protein
VPVSTLRIRKHLPVFVLSGQAACPRDVLLKMPRVIDSRLLSRAIFMLRVSPRATWLGTVPRSPR